MGGGAVLGLHCYVGFSLVVASRGCSLVAVLKLLTAVAPLVDTSSRALGLNRVLEHRFNSCGALA